MLHNNNISLENEIRNELLNKGADFVHFVDISHLDADKGRGLPNTVLLGIALSPAYIKEVTGTPDYVKARIENNYDFDDDEYLLTENKTHELSDWLAAYLTGKGYQAYSQSDENLLATDGFDAIHSITRLPHKTVAVMAGIGWIGKNNLLVTREYGSGLCLGTVLTDAPVNAIRRNAVQSLCNNCKICQDICEVRVLKGHTWNLQAQREDMIDVYHCTTCIKCLMHCPWTQAYSKNKM